MLSESKIYAVVPAADIGRAKDFYREKLGLEPSMEAPGGCMYSCGDGTMFNMYETPNAGSAQNTAMGWSVTDLDACMADLQSRGVTFEKYDLPGADPETGVVTMGGIRAAWFTDSEGNILCVSQPE